MHMKSIVNDSLEMVYSREIPTTQISCLHSAMLEAQQAKPFHGKIVLVNCHLTLFTLVLLDALLKSGAKVAMTATDELTVHEYLLDVLAQADIPFYSHGNIPEAFKKNYYDVVFDCGAGLLHKVLPKNGTVELTYTQQNLYKNISYPVISVDQSETKVIETFYGTGDGFVRAFYQHWLEKELPNNTHLRYLASQNTNHAKNSFAKKVDSLLWNNQFIILGGGGKVGSGIVDALTRAKVHKDNIIIIDKNPNALKLANLNGYKHTLLLNSETTLDEIKQWIASSFCFITATGRKGVVSEYFERGDFPAHVNLVNMSTSDDYGAKFDLQDVLNDKKALNFSLRFPTQPKLLDPIFAALFKTGIHLLKFKCEPGFQKLPEAIDIDILIEWQQKIGELDNNMPIWQLLSSKTFDKYTTTLMQRRNSQDSMESTDEGYDSSLSSSPRAASYMSTSDSEDECDLKIVAKKISPPASPQKKRRSMSSIQSQSLSQNSHICWNAKKILPRLNFEPELPNENPYNSNCFYQYST
jgi:adenosylhomocysteinase